jgi:hypothetical protein
MADKAPQLYVCKNIPACALGTPNQFGRFTGGMTADQKHLLTGHPLEALVEGEDYGEGFCPQCGEEGEAWDQVKAIAAAVAEAEAAHKAHIEEIKKGVS